MSYGQPPGNGGFNPPPGSAPGFGSPPGGGYGPPEGGGFGSPVGGPSGPTTDPLAYASLGLDAVSLLSCFCCGVFGLVIPIGWMVGAGIAGLCGLVATVLGFFSLHRINTEPERYSGKELAIAGVVLGILTFLLGVLMVILTVVLGAAYFAAMTNGGLR